MRENMIRLSFDIPVEEHVSLKAACAFSRMSMKEFLQHLVHDGVKELEKKQLKKRLEKAIQQSKEGKVKSCGSFAKYVEDEI